MMFGLKPFRIGYEVDSSVPHAMACFNQLAKFQAHAGLFPNHCRRPGTEIELLQMLVNGLNKSQNYNLTMFNSGDEIDTAVQSNRLDLSGKVDSVKNQPPENTTFLPSIMTKHYCFIFPQPKDSQFLSSFSPFHSYEPTTWILWWSALVLSVIIASLILSNGKLPILWRPIEKILMASDSDVSTRLSSTILIYGMMICAGLFKILFSTRISSLMIPKQVPGEWSTMNELYSYLKLTKHHLHVKPKYTNRYKEKYFSHPGMWNIADLFNKRKISLICDEDRLVSQLEDGKSVTEMETFIMPLSGERARLLRTKNTWIKIICLLRNVEKLESMLVHRKRRLVEPLARLILRITEMAVQQQLSRRYIGVPIGNGKMERLTTNMLYVRPAHFRVFGITLFIVYSVTFVLFITEIGIRNLEVQRLKLEF